VVRSLALFVNALHADDQKFVALNKNLAQFTNSLTGSDQDLANAVTQFDGLLTTVRPFLDKNADVLTHDINNLADTTNTLVQPEPLNGLETGLHILPTALSNANLIYHPAHSAIVGQPAGVLGTQGFANPMEFVCSAIQAGSRLGYQESAELCAQYLAPILDAIKFNYPPFGLNLFSLAATLPKEVAYSENRLHPPDGYKDTTVPGIWVPDTPTSHRNTQHGWITAPGMQGVKVGPITAGPVDPRIARRADGRSRHRAGAIQLPDSAGLPERLQRRARTGALHRRAGQPGTDSAAAAGTRGDPRSRRTDAGARTVADGGAGTCRTRVAR